MAASKGLSKAGRECFGVLITINSLNPATGSASRSQSRNAELLDVTGAAHMISTLKISVLGTKPTYRLYSVYFSSAPENVS